MNLILRLKKFLNFVRHIYIIVITLFFTNSLSSAKDNTDYRKMCGIEWRDFQMIGADGFEFQYGKENHIRVSKNFVRGDGKNTLPIRIGLEWGDVILNINGQDNFKNLAIEKYFSNLKSRNYIIFKRKNNIKMIKFNCPPT
jgi:hypothetical protein